MRQAWCATALGDVMLRLGPRHWKEAERWYQEALALAEAIGARSALAAAATGAGQLALAQRELETARRLFHQAMVVAREIGFTRLQMRAEQLVESAGADCRASV